MKTVYMVFVTLFIFLVIAGTVMLVGIIDLYTLTNRVQGYMTNAAWAGFSVPDLDKLASRTTLSDEESRNTYLDKVQADEKIRDAIKENLKLDNDYYPTEESFIKLKGYPVIVEELIVYNPDDLPDTAPNGKHLTETSVYIKICFPMHIKLVGDVYKEVESIVDTKTFYSRIQRNRMGE